MESDQTKRLEKQKNRLTTREWNESLLAGWEGMELSQRMDAAVSTLYALESIYESVQVRLDALEAKAVEQPTPDARSVAEQGAERFSLKWLADEFDSWEQRAAESGSGLTREAMIGAHCALSWASGRMQEAIEATKAAAPDARSVGEQGETHDVKCEDCGLPYGGPGWMDASLTNEDFAKISTTGDGCGVLCITCMARRCEARGMRDIPLRIVSGPFVSPTEEAIFHRGWKLGHDVASQEAEQALPAERERVAEQAGERDAKAIAKDLRAECNGHPVACIPWPHRILHEAADALEAHDAGKAELERVRKSINQLSQRCGFPIVTDLVQVLGTIGNMVERVRRERDEARESLAMTNWKAEADRAVKDRDKWKRRAEEADRLLEEASQMLGNHHDARLCTWTGECPVCSKKGREKYPVNIFGRIQTHLQAQPAALAPRAGEGETGWRDASREKPESKARVLCRGGTGFVATGLYRDPQDSGDDESGWFWDSWQPAIGGVTHWMPLPAPPLADEARKQQGEK